MQLTQKVYYIRILQFLENFKEDELRQALEQSVQLMAVTETAILHLLKRNKEGRPANLALVLYPKIPLVHVADPNLALYSARLLNAYAPKACEGRVS